MNDAPDSPGQEPAAEAGDESVESGSEHRELRRENDRLWAVVAGLDDGIWDWDLRSGAIWWSPRLFQMLGYADGEFEPTLERFQQMLHPSDRREQIAHIERLMRGSETEETEYRLRAKGGDYRWLRARGRTLRDGRGEAVRMAGSVRDITEHRRAQAALEESERRLATLMSNLPGMAYRCRVDRDWTMEFISGGVEEVTGYSSEDLVESRRIAFADLIHPDDRAEVQRTVRRGLASGGAFELMYRIITAQGEERWVWERGRRVSDPDAGLVRLEGFIEDVTDRRQAEEAHRRSEEYFRALFEQSPEGIGVAGRDDRVLLCNQTLATMMGCAPADLQGKLIRDLYVNPQERDEVLAAFRRDGSVSGRAVRLRRADGEEIWASLTLVPFLWKSEQAVLATLIDITERNQAAQALRDSEERLRYIVEHATNMFYSHTPDHRLTYASPQSRQLLGCEPEEAMVRWTEFVTDHPVNQRGFELTQRAIDTGVTQEPYELQLRTRDGRIVWVEVHEAPVVRGGRTIAIVGALTDITDRHEAWEQLQRQAALERMLRRELDHRVRNNLTSLIALIDMAAQKARDPEQLAASMRSRVNAMATVHSLLSDEHWQPVDFRSILQRTLTAEDSRMVSLNGPEVLIAPERVQPLVMVMNELATNSRKHGALSAAGGHVRVNWRVGRTEDASLLEIIWHEADGPTLAEDIIPGVGLQLVNGLTKAELGGSVELNFPADGVQHRLWISLEA